ncbi:MAG: rhomboid family intramembrane serine protease [Syntrophomonadaceae bacterium]|jgi:membrane associated rhomboid family serine protease
MFPLRDSTPSDHFPLVTVGIIIVNLLVFLFESGLSEAQLNAIIYQFGFVPAYIQTNQIDPIVYIPFLTSMFLHGSWMHVIGNMWMLWLFGDNVEDCMGRRKFLLFYLGTGTIAALSHYLTDPLSTIPVVGASGAVAGIMGAYFLMFKRARVLTFIFPIFLINIPAWFFLGMWAITQLWSGAASLLHNYATSSGQIAFWAHIGGFAAGMLLYRLFLKPQARQRLANG